MCPTKGLATRTGGDEGDAALAAPEWPREAGGGGQRPVLRPQGRETQTHREGAFQLP